MRRDRWRDSAESDRPTRIRPESGSEDRLSTLQREDAEEFEEFFHEGKASAPPRVRSFEEDARLKRPPPDCELNHEHWLGLHDGTRVKLWRLYSLDNPSTIEDDEESSRMVEAIARARKERLEKRAREDFEREHASKSEDPQNRLDEAARQLWDNDHTRQRAEERIAEAEARIKELRAEATAASRIRRETFDQYRKLCQEWRAEEMKSRRKGSGTFHQDLVLEPLKLPDLPPSVRPFEDQKQAEPQRSAASPLDNAKAARAGSASVGSTSERRLTLEARRTPQARGLLAKFVYHSKTLGRWKFLSLRELEAERLEPPALRAIAELDRTLDNDLSWRSSFPGLVDIRIAMLRELPGIEQHGELLPGTASGGLGRPSKFGSCDSWKSSRGPDRREAST